MKGRLALFTEAEMDRYYDFSWTRDGRVVEVHVEWAGHVRPADYR